MIEHIILANLIENEEYSRKTLPFLKDEYFKNQPDKLAFQLIDNYVKVYNALPTKEALYIELQNKTGISQDTFEKTTELIFELNADVNTKQEWLLEQSEKFCQDAAVYNAVFEAISILDGKTEKLTKGAIPELLQNALAVSFDTTIGHNFLEDWERRYELYHTKEAKIAFDLEFFNIITKGGVSRKTLNVILAGTGVGKTLAMCHFAASHLSQGYNVLYITMEMAEERIAERIDANLLDLRIDELSSIDKTSYQSRILKLREKTQGKLVIKEYPTSSASSSNFKHLLNELKLKKNFIPDIIYIDYINICCSSRVKYSVNINSYTYIKSIAEELRGLAVEFDVPIITATQTTRSGYTNTDVGLEDTSESFGLPATADLMFALIVTEELQELNQIMVKQLKNRYNDPTYKRKFVIGVDRSKMRLYDVEQNAQDDLLIEDTPIMDETEFGIRYDEDIKAISKYDRFNGII